MIFIPKIFYYLILIIFRIAFFYYYFILSFVCMFTPQLEYEQCKKNISIAIVQSSNTNSRPITLIRNTVIQKINNDINQSKF